MGKPGRAVPGVANTPAPASMHPGLEPPFNVGVVREFAEADPLGTDLAVRAGGLAVGIGAILQTYSERKWPVHHGPTAFAQRVGTLFGARYEGFLVSV